MPQPITQTAPCPHCGSEAVFENSHPYVVDAFSRNDVRCRISGRLSYCGAAARGEHHPAWYLNQAASATPTPSESLVQRYIKMRLEPVRQSVLRHTTSLHEELGFAVADIQHRGDTNRLSGVHQHLGFLLIENAKLEELREIAKLELHDLLADDT